ncbi:MAG: insulinase family protein [Clostridia bacterium]|nr:insulinase family protein [Clostridia bacterium]
MKTRIIEIAKGVKLNYINTDKFKTNYVSFNFVAPLTKEDAHYNAMLPLIMMRACEKYPSQAEINKRLQYLYSGDIGARNDAFGEYQIFGMKVNMLNNRFTPDTDVTIETIDLLCQMIFKPYLVNGVFDKEFTNGEKINLIDTIEAEINNKGKYAIKRLMSEMCKDEVYGISNYGSVEDVEKITSESLYDAYQRALKTYNIEIYVVGDCDIDAVCQKFKENFDTIERAPIEVERTPIVEKATSIKEVVDIENVQQGKLVLGFRTGYDYKENKYHLLQLFNEIYGGSPTAKLFMNVREKMSLCYYCRSMVNQRTGIMLVSSGVEAKNKEIAQNAIVEQLDMIKNGEITDEEFINAKKSIKNGYMSIYDSAEAMETWVFLRSLCDIITTPKDECEKIAKTTIKEIEEIANRITLDTVYFLKGEEKEEK